jgi:LacI family transcriptional regulator
LKKRPQVALLIETSNAYARGLLGGISAYVREHDSWSIFLPELGRGDAEAARLEGWKGDGIIARIENRRIARALARSKAPVVDVSAAQLFEGVPWVETDNRAIAALAFGHLRERGFRHFGFCGLRNFNWSLWRRDHFCALAREAGIEVAVHMAARPTGHAADWAAEQRALVKWVGKLPKPVGIFACFDLRGRQLLDACRSAGVRVPDDVAVVGVDNDPLTCELADPPLSSVEPDTHRTGYVAAELLDRIMRGGRVKRGEYAIPPLGIAARRSTDALAINDPIVSAAVRFIREHACDGITVDQVIGEVAVSRRILEKRFRDLVGRTPHEEIVRCRVARAKQLLATTDLPLKAIAERIGVGQAEYVNVIFRKLTGQSPGAYRREFRRHNEPAGRGA